MSTRVEITLPDEVYHRAERLAQVVSRNVSDLLADTITLALPSLTPHAQKEQPITELADQKVLALADLQMPPAQDQRLGNLLDKQQAGTLTDSEPAELLALMQVYQEGLLRKAQALREAVRRGLRAPLEP
jgi:CopG-like RHH_1 or ribbon-helix-helix domain, RHH_5